MKRFMLLCLWLGTVAIGCGKEESADNSLTALQKEEQPETPSEDRGTVQSLTNSVGMTLALIPAGEFWMGSPDSDPNVREDEKPQHRVRITNPFYMGMYEVTQEEYERVMGTKRSFFSSAGPGKDKVVGLNTARFPAEQVTWHRAVEFCRRLSELPAEKRSRRVYRLPTEAEWEYACRAGTTTAFHFGDSLSSFQANFNGEYPYGGAPQGPFLARTTEVGSYAPNAFGLYDMHGNVWEWCADWHGIDYYKESPTDDPTGPTSGSMRVIRGGEWYGDARDCRSAFRYSDIPTGVFYVMGFRVVMTTSESATAANPPISGRRKVVTSETPEPAPSGDTPAAIVPADHAALSQGELWPRWRGPRGDGTWNGPQIPEEWPDSGLRRLWRQPIGGGYAGVVATGGRVYTMDYQPQTLPTGPNGRPEVWEERVTRPVAPAPLRPFTPSASTGKNTGGFERVLCFDATTGDLLWSHSYPVNYRDVEYGNGPRATPTVFDERVYTLGAVGHLHCLDAATGKLLWWKDLAGTYQASVPIWGLAASPVVFESLLIVHAGVQPNGSLIALDLRTGEEVWRNLPDQAGYATPILIESSGFLQLVCWTPTNVRGLDPRTGKMLWTIPFEVTYSTSIATPIFRENIVLVSGYYEGSKAIGMGRDPAVATIVWEDRRNLRALMSQPLYRNGYAYLLDKRHGLTCFKLKTGKKIWDAGNRMTPKGRNPQATMVWIGDGDRAVVLNSDGDLILARFRPTGYEEQSRTNIIGRTWAHPAYAGACAYARNDSELVCVSLLEANPARAESPE